MKGLNPIKLKHSRKYEVINLAHDGELVTRHGTFLASELPAAVAEEMFKRKSHFIREVVPTAKKAVGEGGSRKS